jgi:hypothetical protein
MDNILIDSREKYVTHQMSLSIWEVRMIERLRQLFNGRDGEFVIRKYKDRIIIRSVGKAEVLEC